MDEARQRGLREETAVQPPSTLSVEYSNLLLQKKAPFMAPGEPIEIYDLKTGSGAPQEPERTLERAIGTQIRDLRQRFHLSVAHLAGAASISGGMLSKIENGQISPSLST